MVAALSLGRHVGVSVVRSRFGHHGWITCRRCSRAATPTGQHAHSVEFVISADRARSIAEELVDLSSDTASSSRASGQASTSRVCDSSAVAVALDCEGVRLGRFGRLCVVQLAAPVQGASEQRLMLFDALRPGLVEALAPLLENREIAKVVHDCREDSAAMFHQHGLRLRGVFDTQAAFAALQHYAGKPPHQASAAELLRLKCGVEDSPEVEHVKALMQRDDKIWAKRPLGSVLIRYALHGVAHLLHLRRTLLQEAAELDSRAGVRHRKGSALVSMASASERALQYRHLNDQFSSAVSMAKIGTRLWALVAARTALGIYCKLNAGRIGLVSTPSAMSRFADVQLGDAVLCCVSGVSVDGSYIYLDRYDDDWDYFDHQLRPSGEPEVGTYGREHRHESTLYTDSVNLPTSSVDPLFLRGLPAADKFVEGARGLDAWEADPEDMGLPPDMEP